MIRRIPLLFLLVLGVTACSPKAEPLSRADQIVNLLHDPSSDYVVVVAHRGDWRNYPENSLQALESCIRMGVDVVEFDLKLTKDSVLVLSHDRTLDRCTTGSGPISDYTYEEILKFDLKAGHGIGRPGIKMPTLREALAVCKDRIIVNLDHAYDYYDLILPVTEELGITEQILIKSGKPLSEVKAKMEKHQRNMMYMPVVTAAPSAQMSIFNAYIDQEKPLLAYELCFRELNDEVRTAARRILDDGSKLWVNTIWASLCGGYEDDAADAADDPDTIYGPILDLGSSIIQTDRPELLIRYLDSKGRHTLPQTR